MWIFVDATKMRSLKKIVVKKKEEFALWYAKV